MKQESWPAARIFVCVNEKAPEKEQCLKGEGEKCVLWLKERIKEAQLTKEITVVRTKCMSYCNTQGTTVVFEPIHTQYSGVRFEDIPRLFEEFLKAYQKPKIVPLS